MYYKKPKSLYERLNERVVFNAGKFAVGACASIYGVGYVGSVVEEVWYKGPTLVCLGLIAMACFVAAVVITANEVT